MDIKEGFFAHLTADADVVALVGSRVYPMVVPQDATLPAIAYQQISGPRDHTHSGASGLVQARMQLTFLGSSYSEARAVADAARDALDGYAGTMGSVAVGSVFLVNERDQWSQGFEVPLVQQDFMVWYQE